MRLKRVLSLIAIVFLVTACSQTGTSPSYPKSQHPTGAPGEFGDRFGSVVVGSQRDLAVNVGDRVFFDTDRWSLKPDARDLLNRQAIFLNRHKKITVTIEGHADERGTREYNLALGEKRASAVRDYLISRGVSSSRVNTISYGKERPAVLGSNPAAWAQNRRAVTVIQN